MKAKMKWDQQVCIYMYTLTLQTPSRHTLLPYCLARTLVLLQTVWRPFILQTLESWLEESAHRDDDAMILAKYSRIDEDQIKSLNLRLEQLQEVAVRKKRLLDMESTETMAAQVRERGRERGRGGGGEGGREKYPFGNIFMQWQIVFK